MSTQNLGRVVGYSILTGSGVPGGSLGDNGDSYLDTSNGDTYNKSSGSWGLNGNIKGNQGNQGFSILSGAGVPSGGLGVDGDSYLNTTNGATYIKASGSWTVNGNIKGATGNNAVISTTSTTSNLIATGSKTFTLVTPFDLVVGQVAKAHSLSDPTNYMVGYITSLSPFTINVSEIGGSGTKTDWVITLGAFRGIQGISTPNITTANRLLGKGAGQSVPSAPAELTPVGLTISATNITADYSNAVSAYNAASGVDTPLTNAMSPITMFQNLQKQNDNRYTKTQGDDRYLPKVAYGFSNGFLVKTDIAANIDQMIVIKLTGNGYSSSLPINVIAQLYNYNPGDEIIAQKAISIGYNFPIYAFNYEGFVQFWIAPLTYNCTLEVIVTTISDIIGNNRVTTVANVVKPVTGVTREVIITPIKAILNNGLSTDLIKGDGSFQSLSTLAPSNYSNAVTNYNAASGVDTALTNGMSPVQMFQNLQKQSDNKLKNTGNQRLAGTLVAGQQINSIEGTVLLQDSYDGGSLLNVFTIRSSGDVAFSRGVAQIENATGFISTVNVNTLRNYISLSNSGIFYNESPAQLIAIGSPVADITTYKVWTAKDTTIPAFTATKLLTARNINGVAFDGSANITIADATKIPTSEKGAANGTAPLGADGKMPNEYLSNLAITDTSVVDSQAAQLALDAQRGDVCVRTDLSKTFILKAEPASTLGNWTEFLTPGGVPNLDAVAGIGGIANQKNLAVNITDESVSSSNRVGFEVRETGSIVGRFSITRDGLGVVRLDAIAGYGLVLGASGYNSIVINNAGEITFGKKVFSTVAPTSDTEVARLFELKAKASKGNKQVAGTVTAIQFDEDTEYGANDDPITATDITTNVTDAKVGVTAKLYIQRATAPTFPSTWKLAVGGGVWHATKVNRVYAQYEDSTHIFYTIASD